MTRKAVVIGSLAASLINFRLHLMLDLKKCGFEVIAMAPADLGVAAKLAEFGIRFEPLSLSRNGLNPLSDIFLLWQLIRFFKREKIYLTFTYTIKPVIYGSLAARIVNIPYRYAMLTGTGYIFSGNTLKSKVVGTIAKALFRLSLHLNRKLFFQNKDNLADFYKEKLISTRQPFAIVNGSGVDINHFSPAPLPKSLSFLMIARLLQDKGVREYVAAAKQIKAIYPEIDFKLVGWVDTNPNSITKNELQQWVTAGYIQFLGKLDDVRETIASSSVYVLPSYGEGTPRTVLEAMAMQRPIITTDVPGCRETVVSQENGLLIPVKDAYALAQAMIHFIKNPDEVVRMGANSRILVETKYDVRKVNQHILTEMEIHEPSPHYSTASL